MVRLRPKALRNGTNSSKTLLPYHPRQSTQKWTEQQAAAAPAVTGSQSETVAAPPAKQADVNGGSLSYAELYKKLNPYKPPTDEELAKEKKKQKREQIFAAIGDGISALSNLFFTTQYAPNMYTGKNTMSERTKVRYDKLMKEREGKEKEYYEGLMRQESLMKKGMTVNVSGKGSLVLTIITAYGTMPKRNATGRCLN